MNFDRVFDMTSSQRPIALAVVGAYVLFYVVPLLIEWGLYSLLLIVVVVGAAGVGYVLYRSTELRKWRQEAFSLRKATIQERLHEPGWVLNFDAEHPKGSKPIEFLEGGMIGQGQNDNEHTWALDGQTLIITRRDGELQNRFLYDETTDRLVSSDDSEASAVKRGYKGQYIYRSTTE